MSEILQSERLRQEISSKNIIRFEFKNKQMVLGSLQQWGQSDICEGDIPDFNGSINFESEEYITLVASLEAKTTSEKKNILRNTIVCKTQQQTAILRADIVTEQKIKDILSELSPEKIDASLRTVEFLIDIVIDPKYKMVLRSYAGSLLLEKFEANNQRIVVGSNNSIKIEYIESSKSTQALDKNNEVLQGSLNKLIQEKSSVFDTIRSGMLFRAQTSAITTDPSSKEVVIMNMKPYSKEDMQTYFKKIANNPNSTTAEKTLSLSRGGFTDFNNPPELQEVLKLESSIQKLSGMPQPVPLPLGSNVQSTPQSGNQIPSVVGEGVGMVGGAIGKIVGSGAKGGLSFVTDMFNSANKEGGAMGGLAVLGMLIASIWKFGFIKTALGIFGIGALSEAAAGRLDLGKEGGKIKNAYEKGTTAVGSLANSAQGVVAGATKPTEQSGEKPAEKPKLTPSQEKAVEKIKKSHPEMNEMIESHIKSQNIRKGIETANIDQYIAFIHSDEFQNRKITDLINPKNFDESIFSSEMDFDRKNINNLNPILLKKLLRVYLTDSFDTDSSQDKNIKRGTKEKDAFMEKYKAKITPNTTFAEIVKEVYPV